MECTCIRYTELPHTTRLFADLVYHPDRVRAFYPYPPYDWTSYAAAAEKIELAPERRAKLVSALRANNGNHSLLDLLAQPGTVAVVTGQQVGLFSGPAYTIYKALTAVKLASQLTALGIPAVPVFWLATEDHDFAEVNHSWIFDPLHRAVKLEIDGSRSSNQPVGEVKLSASPINALRECLRDFPYGEDATALVEQTYTPGQTLGQAFGDLLRRILTHYSVLQIDPMSPKIRELAAPAIRSAVASAPELTRVVLDRNRELVEAGYHAQVHVEDHTSFVFLLENGRRVPLRRHERDYLSQGRRFSTDELMDRAEQLSPNALLRPVIQDSILPTVAYVGGPAELAYLAQAEVIYRIILGRTPVAVHRAGFTVLDEHSRRLMMRYRLRIEELFHGEEVLRERIAAALTPPELSGLLEQARGTTRQAIDRLASSLVSFDPTLENALQKSRRKIEYQLSKIEAKVRREVLHRDARAQRDASFLHGLVYPEKHLQERFYSILPFLAKYGLDVIDRLYENVHLDCPDHQLLVI